MAKTRVLILGGGMSSLVTAYNLAFRSDPQKEYQITLLQQGWRLGGKGASGRNQAEHDRIEEHGLHLLFGFYDNAFRILRDCYQRETGNADAWTSGFTPLAGPVVMPTTTTGRLETWELPCPRNDFTPGDDHEIAGDPWALTVNLLAWLRASIDGGHRDADLDLDELRGHRAAIEACVAALRANRTAPSPARYAKLAWLLADATPQTRSERTRGDYDLLYQLADGVIEAQRAHGRLSKPALMADFGYTVVKGLLSDLVIARRSWFDLDVDDLRDWLRHHGATEETCASPMVGGLYNAVFSDGHTLGAGTILQAMLRALFTFKGAFIYKMEGGMGDVVFAPLYRVLRDRVCFKFFHRVDELRLSADGTRVAEVRVTEQVPVREGPYRPLIDDKYWPSEPLWEQLDGDPTVLRTHDLESSWDDLPGRQHTLNAADYDVIVLGISVGALADICKDMMFDSKNPKFQWMVRGVATVQTQAAQIWFDQAELGWRGSVVIPFDEPFDTAADMRHILAHEGWDGAAKSLAYLCSPLPDVESPPAPGPSDYGKRQLARVQADLDQWRATSAARLWPTVEPSTVVSTYVNAPTNLSDRYVLATQNSNRYRLRAHESGYSNLILTGDWTRTALSVGCLEAATMAGIQSARAIDAHVPKATGDWLPDPTPPQAARAATRAAAAADASYVYRDGDIVSKPPVTLDLFVYTFVVRADYDQLRRLCRSQLATTSTEYRPLGPFVILYCSQLDNVVQPFGSAREVDFGIWIPVAAGVPADAGFVPERVLTFSPYVWIDSGLALVGGRSVFGFPKQLGKTMKMPTEDDDPAAMALECEVLPTWTTETAVQPLFEVTRDPAGPRGPLVSSFGDWANFLAAVAPLVSEWVGGDYPLPSWEALAHLISRPGNPMVFLKQFPDATDQQGAAYRAVIEAPVDFTADAVRGGPLAGTYTITFHEYASHRIAWNLGLSGVATGPGQLAVTPIAAGWGQFKSILGRGKIIP